MNLAALNLTEKEWQSKVTDLATLHGWRWYHTHDSRRSPSGFPDLVLVRGDRVIFAELKKENGKVSPHQTAWLTALTATPAEVYVWRPSDWPDVLKVLAR